MKNLNWKWEMFKYNLYLARRPIFVGVFMILIYAYAMFKMVG